MEKNTDIYLYTLYLCTFSLKWSEPGSCPIWKKVYEKQQITESSRENMHLRFYSPSILQVLVTSDLR